MDAAPVAPPVRRDRAKTLATLAVLLASAPLTAAVALPVWLLGLPFRRKPAAGARCVLVSGGKMSKAGLIARAFHRAGHRVVMAETERYSLTGHRFSRAVHAFVQLPEPNAPGYADALREVIQTHGVDVYVPVCSPAASIADARAKPDIQALCDVVHLGPEGCARVDDKHAFSEAARAKGLSAPKSYRITDPQQVLDHDWSVETRPFIIKSIAYDAIRRLDLTPLPRPTRAQTAAFLATLPISESNPWVMQEFIEGTEYCTHGTVRDGRLTVHIACESSPFQINYEHVPRADMRDWVERFVAGTGYTGQLSFDFIEASDDGRLYAIECNPRTHSAITLFKGRDGLAEAYLGERAGVLEPAGARPTYWLAHELFRLLTGHGMSRRSRMRTILRGRDAVWSLRDPLPFFMLHHVHIPSLLLRELREGRGWHRIDFNIGKLVQQGGD